MRRFIFCAIFFLISFGYASASASTPMQKPFVYRQLVPALVEIVPFQTHVSQFVVQSLFCVLLGMLMLYIYENERKPSVYGDAAVVASYAGVFAVIIVLGFHTYIKKDYDIPTAFLFTLIFYLWTKEKYALTIPLFALSCINRETTIIIVPVLFLLRVKWHIHIYQVAVWIGVNTITHEAFSDSAGSSALIRPVENILAYTGNPAATIVMSLVATVVVVMFMKNATRQFKTFMLLLPVLFALHIVAGYPYEIRVFAEVLPILFLGSLMKGDKVEKEIKKEAEEIPAMFQDAQNILSR
jgi:hypothetical protein